MTVRKTFKELTIKDNFMFGAIMCKEDNCRRLLELVLEVPIARVEVSKEKSIVYHPEYKGVRLDVYAKDEKNTHFNVEMQTVPKAELGKRARYYHSQIDMEMLEAGAEYPELANSYVIFICDFDPFGWGKYRYTFRNLCLEEELAELNDGCETIFLSTKGTNDEDVPPALRRFLKYVGADQSSSTEDFEDEFVAQLQKTVKHVKESRRMEGRYMLTELLMQDERRVGRIEGREAGKLEARRDSILEQLSEIGNVPDALIERIKGETDIDRLKLWTKLVMRVDSVEQFMEEL
ncbi:MAG: Rpn family recombination-promoting nuclease/putative transposase [Lachnospiraceae bacterium]|nr:Rpn family recombination-promoting nuclease/putative transposase [Lachnospiraceae bacterium]MBQ6857123.1 Rpn family recombination-promoting nuclease/putative transposase [Lachnospiraceae bacterium]